jgi:hypothetical protein
MKHHFIYTERLTPKRVSIKLRVGGYVHLFLEQLYLTENIGFAVKAFDEAVEKDKRKAEENELEVREEDELEVKCARVLCEEYARRIFPEDLDKYAVIEAEKWFQIPIMETKEKLFILRGKIDGIWRRRRTKELVKLLREHKTARDFNPDVNNLLLDFQISTYAFWWMAYEGITDPVVGYNVLKKVQLQPATLRKEKRKETQEEFLTRVRADIQKRPAFYFIRTEIQRSFDEIHRFMKEFLSILEIIYLSPKGPPVYRNPQPRCHFMCDMREVCIENTEAMRESLYDVKPKRPVDRKDFEILA